MPAQGRFDPFATLARNGRYLREAAGWNRRKSAIPDRGVDIAIGGIRDPLATARVAVIPPAPRPCVGRQ